MKFNSKFLVAAKLPQHHSGSYRDLDIVIEWPKNSVRTGKDAQGSPWKRKMLCDYGFVPDTVAAGSDKEGLDVYIGSDENSDKVYVVEQLKDEGEFDEYKVLLGFNTLEEARNTYLAHYPEDWEDTHLGEIFEVPFDYAFEKIEEHREKHRGKNPQPKTAKSQSMYHVTETKNVPRIMSKGLLCRQPSNWVEQGSGSRYGDGEVYAFTDERDALRWAARMDWAHNKKMGTGKISIVRFRSGNEEWEPDNNDPISQLDRKGDWLKTNTPIPASQIVDATPFGQDSMKKLKFSNNTAIFTPSHHHQEVPEEALALGVINGSENPSVDDKNSGLAYMGALQSMQS